MKAVPMIGCAAVILLACVATAAEPPTLPAGFIAKPGAAAEPYTKTGLPKEIVHQATGMELVFIPAGEFDMGTATPEKDSRQTYKYPPVPVHRVRITRPFYMGKYAVTQKQWKAVYGNDEGHGVDRRSSLGERPLAAAPRPAQAAAGGAVAAQQACR